MEHKKSNIGGLVVHLKYGEAISLDDNAVLIEVVEKHGAGFRVAIKAPQCVKITRVKVVDHMREK